MAWAIMRMTEELLEEIGDIKVLSWPPNTFIEPLPPIIEGHSPGIKQFAIWHQDIPVGANVNPTFCSDGRGIQHFGSWKPSFEEVK